MKAPISSQKHYVQMSLTPVTTGARINNPLAIARESTSADLVDEVTEGSVIKAIYIELWIQGTSGTQTSIVILEKAVAGAVGAAFANMAGLGTYLNKKNVLFTHQGITGNDGVSGPQNIMRGWYKIPKGKQRMGLGDRLVLSVANQTSGGDINFCGFAIYKEYT